MSGRRAIWIMAAGWLLLSTAGCGTYASRMWSTAAGRHETALISYTAMVEAIQILADAGEITKEEAPKYALRVRAAKRAIDVWHARVLADVDAKLAEQEAMMAMAKLRGAIR